MNLTNQGSHFVLTSYRQFNEAIVTSREVGILFCEIHVKTTRYFYALIVTLNNY